MPPNEWQHVRYVVWQAERGALMETEHLQGYVVFNTPMTLAAVRKCNGRAHWEIRAGTHEEARAYCMKADTRISGPYEHGEQPRQGERTDLAAVAEYARDHTLADIADTYPVHYIRYHRGLQAFKFEITRPRSHKTDLIIYWGPPGTGKSRRAYETWPGAFWLNKGRDGNVWWDGYEGQETVVIDEFYGWLSIDFMSRLIDRYPLAVEVKGGTVQFIARRVVITSNVHPDGWWKGPYHGMRRRIDEAEVTYVGPAPERILYDEVTGTAHVDTWVI